MKTTNLKFKIIGIAVLAILLVFAISGVISIFSDSKNGSNEITYIDKSTSGNIDISFSEEGDLIVKDEALTNSDIYFAGTQSNFLNFRQQKTMSSKYGNRSYTNYELEVLAYSDSDCKNLVKYIVTWGDEFEIYQILKYENASVGSYLKTLENAWDIDDEISKATMFYIGNSTLTNDFNIEKMKGLETFEMCSSLYFNNGDYKFELTSEKNLLEVFTIILKTLVSSQASESDGTQINVALDLSNFCTIKIFNQETGTYQRVTNKVCLNTSLFKFSRQWQKNVRSLISEFFGDFPYLVMDFYSDSNANCSVVTFTGYVIKY